MAALLVAMSFYYKKPNKASLIINFKNYVGENPLKLDTLAYVNGLGQRYSVTNFKYYISNFVLKAVSGKDVKISGSYLINEDFQEIDLKAITNGEYFGIEFIIGVDSLHNCSGAQSGALDPINGMFWAWNTGYIFLKLEGKSPSSKNPGNYFEYHIGGYRTPANCIRKIYLNFKNKMVVNDCLKEITIKTNVSEILSNPTSINFEQLNSVTDTRNANIIANNYQDMFSIIHEN